jgi:hypothetical protein
VRTPRLLAAALLLVCGTSSIAVAATREETRATATEAMLRGESLGSLRLGMPEKDLLKLLGKPGKQGATVLQGADGMYVQEWSYPGQGLILQMSAGKKTGAKSVAHFTATAPCMLATRLGIKIGSEESAVRKAYGAYLDRDSPAEAGTFVAGSVYGGIIFNFSKGKVSRIFFGAAAE